MPKRSIRLTDAIDQRIQSAAKQRGYSTPSAFLRAAIKKELNEPGEGSGANEKILGSIREVRQDVRRVERAQQALFALVDNFAKVFVTCVPEPRGEAMQAQQESGSWPLMRRSIFRASPDRSDRVNRR
jgi:Arc/MetJ-type ribon-helix-helix transcriptional regulator